MCERLRIYDLRFSIYDCIWGFRNLKIWQGDLDIKPKNRS